MQRSLSRQVVTQLYQRIVRAGAQRFTAWIWALGHGFGNLYFDLNLVTLNASFTEFLGQPGSYLSQLGCNRPILGVDEDNPPV